MQIPAATARRRVWLRVGNLIDRSGAWPTKDAHVVYDAEQILHVGGTPPTHLVNEGQQQPDAHLPRHTLLPGLIEAHAHFFLEGGELDAGKRVAYLQQPPATLLELARPRLEKLLRLGIMAVRDAGDKDGVGLALSRLYKSSERPLMPYVDSPGAAIHHKGRYGSFMGEPVENYPTPHDCVAGRVQAGADRIKLIPTGIINFEKGAVTTAPQMTAEEVTALVTAAKSFQRQTFAHASGDAGIENAITGGVDTVEHGFFLRDDQLARMRDQQIAWVPTFAPVQAQVDHAKIMGWSNTVVENLMRIIDNHAASLVEADKLGVTIIAGSDAGSYGVPHGVGLLRELELMERARLRSWKVIHAATGASWGRLGFPEKFGMIKAGFKPRMILTEYNPVLDSVTQLFQAKLVIFDGVPLPPADESTTVGM